MYDIVGFRQVLIWVCDNKIFLPFTCRSVDNVVFDSRQVKAVYIRIRVEQRRNMTQLLLDDMKRH